MSILSDNEHLPNIVTKVDGIKDVLDAISPEIEQLKLQISQTIKELFAQTTELEIERWERDLGLMFDSTLTITQRRINIINKLQAKNVLTWNNLDLLIKNNIENVPYYVVNNSKQYAFKVVVASSNIEQLEKALKKAKPAYLTFTIEVIAKYERYCGTFISGTNPL